MKYGTCAISCNYYIESRQLMLIETQFLSALSENLTQQQLDFSAKVDIGYCFGYFCVIIEEKKRKELNSAVRYIVINMKKKHKKQD